MVEGCRSLLRGLSRSEGGILHLRTAVPILGLQSCTTAAASTSFLLLPTPQNPCPLRPVLVFETPLNIGHRLRELRASKRLSQGHIQD